MFQMLIVLFHQISQSSNSGSKSSPRPFFLHPPEGSSTSTTPPSPCSHHTNSQYSQHDDLESESSHSVDSSSGGSSDRLTVRSNSERLTVRSRRTSGKFDRSNSNSSNRTDGNSLKDNSINSGSDVFVEDEPSDEANKIRADIHNNDMSRSSDNFLSSDLSAKNDIDSLCDEYRPNLDSVNSKEPFYLHEKNDSRSNDFPLQHLFGQFNRSRHFSRRSSIRCSRNEFSTG